MQGPGKAVPKTEPEGEDEAQSLNKGFDYGSLYNEDESSTSLSCLTGSLCSGSESFTFKYQPAPVDSGSGNQEILWAY
jgi:hypothetical protein